MFEASHRFECALASALHLSSKQHLITAGALSRALMLGARLQLCSARAAFALRA